MALPADLSLGAAVLRRLLRHRLISLDDAMSWIHERASGEPGYPDWLDGLLSASAPDPLVTALGHVPGIEAHAFDVTGPFVVSALIDALAEPLTPQRAHVLVTEPYLLTQPTFARELQRLTTLHALAEQNLPSPALPMPTAEQVTQLARALRPLLEATRA